MGDNCQEIAITILGTKYHLKTDMDRERLVNLSEHVGNEMVEIRRKASDMPVAKIAVLAALRIAEELFDERKQNEHLKKQVTKELEKFRSDLMRPLV